MHFAKIYLTVIVRPKKVTYTLSVAWGWVDYTQSNNEIYDTPASANGVNQPIRQDPRQMTKELSFHRLV